jgi:hypothetical protein
VEEDIKRRRRVVGRAIRMGQTKLSTNIFASNREGKRQIERPRLGWLEDVENDLRELKPKIWKEEANNTEQEVLGRTNRLLSFDTTPTA